jgi:hypothetical protein
LPSRASRCSCTHPRGHSLNAMRPSAVAPTSQPMSTLLSYGTKWPTWSTAPPGWSCHTIACAIYATCVSPLWASCPNTIAAHVPSWITPTLVSITIPWHCHHPRPCNLAEPSNGSSLKWCTATLASAPFAS